MRRFGAHSREIVRAVLLGWVMVSPIGTNATSNDEQLLPAEQVFIAEVQMVPGEILLRWRIAPGYYVYRDKFAVTLPAGSGQAIEALELPRGLKKSDEFFGEVEVFYNAARVVVVLAPLATRATLELDIVYQGCADIGLCYPPVSQLIVLDVAAPP